MNTQPTKPPGSAKDPRPTSPQTSPSQPVSPQTSPSQPVSPQTSPSQPIFPQTSPAQPRSAPLKPGGYPGSAGVGGNAAPLQPVMDDAAATARSLANDMKETAKGVASEAARASADLSSDLKQAAQAAQRAAKAQASEFAADVGHELGHSAEQQKARGVEAMQGFARAINSAAGELEGQSPMVARYVRDAAHNVENLSNNLRGKSVTELMRAASDLARSQPAVFIAGAVASGFALSRFLKSSATRTGADASSSSSPQRGPAAGRAQAAASGGVSPGRS
jgi:hypothetical protein